MPTPEQSRRQVKQAAENQKRMEAYATEPTPASSLVAELRNPDMRADRSMLMNKAADRIEELEGRLAGDLEGRYLAAINRIDELDNARKHR